MESVGHVASMRDNTNAYTLLMENLEDSTT